MLVLAAGQTKISRFKLELRHWSGAELICAEMVYNPMQLYTTDDVNNVTDEIKFLYTIRCKLYILAF